MRIALRFDIHSCSQSDMFVRSVEQRKANKFAFFTCLGRNLFAPSVFVVPISVPSSFVCAHISGLCAVPLVFVFCAYLCAGIHRNGAIAGDACHLHVGHGRGSKVLGPARCTSVVLTH